MMSNNTPKLKVLIAGGGTGGHLFPAIAIGDALVKDNIKVKYVGSKYGIESSYKFINKNNIFLLDLRGIQRTLSLNSFIKNLTLPIKIIKSTIQIRKLLNSFKPDMIIGTGGYSCALPLYFGIKKNILTGVQEQNVIPGMVTKRFYRQADVVFTSFLETAKYLNKGKVFYTGNPIRSSIKKSNIHNAKSELGLSPEKFTVLFMGGSQGALAINKYLKNRYKKYIDNDIQLIWQTGERSKHLAKSVDHPKVKIYSFINEIDKIYAASDLIVSRAGATAISEILYLEKPSILIPYPFAANNHQEVNANTLEKNNVSIKINQKDLLTKKLENIVIDLSKSENKINIYKENAKKYSKDNSASLIKDKIKDMILNAR